MHVRLAKKTSMVNFVYFSAVLIKEEVPIHLKGQTKIGKQSKIHNIPFLCDFRNRNKLHMHCQSASENITKMSA